MNADITRTAILQQNRMIQKYVHILRHFMGHGTGTMAWLFVPLLVRLCGSKGQISQYRSKTKYKVGPTCMILGMAMTRMLIEFVDLFGAYMGINDHFTEQ